MDELILGKMLKLSEEFFGSQAHPDYIPFTMEACRKFQLIHPNWIVYKIKDGEPISWVVVLPTQTNLMNQFIKGEINERQLLDLTKPEVTYEALYLCSAFTIPEYRRQGYIVKMFGEAIKGISLTDNFVLFAWPVTEEGKKVVKKLESVFGHKILLK